MGSKGLGYKNQGLGFRRLGGFHDIGQGGLAKHLQRLEHVLHVQVRKDALQARMLKVGAVRLRFWEEGRVASEEPNRQARGPSKAADTSRLPNSPAFTTDRSAKSGAP